MNLVPTFFNCSMIALETSIVIGYLTHHVSSKISSRSLGCTRLVRNLPQHDHGTYRKFNWVRSCCFRIHNFGLKAEYSSMITELRNLARRQSIPWIAA